MPCRSMRASGSIRPRRIRSSVAPLTPAGPWFAPFLRGVAVDMVTFGGWACLKSCSNSLRSSSVVVRRFRGSLVIAAFSDANLGNIGARQDDNSSAAFRFEVPGPNLQQTLQELQIGGTGDASSGHHGKSAAPSSFVARVLGT